VLQFVNNNCPGATSLIGGLRLGLDDVRKVPAYLEKIGSAQALRYQVPGQAHKSEPVLCGSGREAHIDDYGISFSLATVSQRAACLTTRRDRRGSSSTASSQACWNRSSWDQPGWTDDFAHVFNVFIHLMPGSQRGMSSSGAWRLTNTETTSSPHAHSLMLSAQCIDFYLTGQCTR
jgi:hypothetical protein